MSKLPFHESWPTRPFAEVAITRSEHTTADLRRAASRLKDVAQARRCLAVAAVLGVSRGSRPAWTGKRCATGCIVTLPRGLRAWRTALARAGRPG